MRSFKKITLQNVQEFKSKLLAWAQQSDHMIWLDSNEYPQKYSSFDVALAIDVNTELVADAQNAFSELQHFKNETKDYIFGYLGYDLKNDIEDLSSTNFDGLAFPDLYFFQPRKLFLIKDEVLEVGYLKSCEDEIDSDLEVILNYSLPNYNKSRLNRQQDNLTSTVYNEVKMHKRITKKEYLKHLKKILNHIHRGDIYEVNFCQEFYANDAVIDPYQIYQHLNQISSPPFAAYLKVKDNYLLSASPERFVRKEGTKVISQPIKGTAKRLQKKKLDRQLAEVLQHDEKERSENIMIVDLVRNDLSKTAIQGSVKVEELCKVYSFKQVHQLISTVTSEVSSAIDSVEIIKSLFPMGSMTGAPKISAMQIIENEESTKRGLYSGAVGYFSPNDNFDFNVVIRSILYSKAKKYLSYSVGGAITAKSDPEKEYQECLLKAIAMKKALKK